MIFKKSYLGIAICALSGCIGDNSTWLSASESTVSENHQGIAYHAQLAGTGSDKAVFSIKGSDAHLFTIDQKTGEVHFVSPPDYEVPEDESADNRYSFTVVAYHELSGIKLNQLKVDIVIEDLRALPIDQLFPLTDSFVVPNSNGVVPLMTKRIPHFICKFLDSNNIKYC